MIEVKNFTKKYEDFIAVNNIPFNVEARTIFAFLGPNGAGKSTTINTLCTILNKTEGDLWINGNDVTEQRSKVRNEIGIVFQDSTFDGKLSVEENSKLHCDFSKEDVKDRINFALEPFDLLQWRNSSVLLQEGGLASNEYFKSSS